jgi:hypothetical protein
LWKFNEVTDKSLSRKFILTFDFVLEKYNGKQEKQIISFKPPFEVKIVKMISLKDTTRIPHPPAIINRKKKSSK